MAGYLNDNVVSRTANLSDIPRVLEIYNQGIEERKSTFETRLREERDILPWLDSGYPFIVVEYGRKVEAFAVSFPYSLRECYSGIAEFSVYVWKGSRSKGLGRAAMNFLMRECEKAGFHKLVSRIFTDNIASRNLLSTVGFREVGIYEKHGKLEGKWRDTVIVECLLTKNSK